MRFIDYINIVMAGIGYMVFFFTALVIIAFLIRALFVKDKPIND